MPELETVAAPAAAEPAAIAPAQTVETPVTETLTPMERLERTMGETYDKINPPRENGKFAAKDKESKAETVEPVKAVEPTKDQTQSQTVEPPTAAIDAPNSWSAENKAKWSTLSPDVQEYIASRENEAHKRISEMGQQVKTFEPITPHIEPLRRIAARFGINEGQVLHNLIAAQDLLTTDPERAIAWLAKTHGVNLPSASAENQTESDIVRSLRSEIAAANRRAEEALSRTAARDRTEQEREQATLAETIQTFAKDKPHFEKVRVHMGSLIESGAAKTLDEAYEQATYALPEIRNQILAEKNKADEEKRAKETEAKAKDAKRVGSLNVKSTGASPAKKGTWEETLRAKGEQLYG